MKSIYGPTIQVTTMNKEEMKNFLSKGINLYTTGILLQIQHEVELESVPDPDKQETLKTIKGENKKLYDVIKHFAREIERG